jgi:outer membrane murein-binding lipoprotein Lpp
METEKKLKNLVIVMAVVAGLLAVVLAWVWIDRNSLVNDLTIDKETLTSELGQLKTDYSTLSSNNDSLNTQLDHERVKVEELIERVKKTEATNKYKIRQYEKELGTLRSIMRGYIVQIDSLNTLNNSLRKDVAAAKDEANQSKQKYNELRSTTDEYAKQVEVGSVVKGRGFNAVAITAANKETDRSSRTAKLKVCTSLIENTLAPKGPMQLYIRVFGPDKMLLTTSEQQNFTVNGERLIYSASREVDYQGSEIEICIYYAGNQGFTKGVYSIDVYTSRGKLGTADVLLK